MAKIGLIDVDGHHGKKKFGATIYPNLALCKISAWHKAKGDIVEWAIPLMEHYDIIYRSKIFNFSRDDDATYFADKVVYGGTGYDIHSQLPKEIDDMQPDLSIYPYLPKGVSYGFLTRGCPNKCSWCVVPAKEGAIVPYWDVDRVTNGNEKIILMDNNILAAGDYGMEQLRKIIERGYRVDFNQALDARLVNPENAKLLANIRWLENNRIRFGCDTARQIDECERAISLIESFGFKDLGIPVEYDYCKFNDKDNPFRKPNTGMLEHICKKNLPKHNITVNKEDMLMIGDASGKEGQFSDSDKKTAENFGIDYLDIKDFKEYVECLKCNTQS